MGNTTVTIIILIIAIVLIIAFFKLVDWLLKGDSPKKGKKEVKTIEKVEKTEKIVEAPVEEKKEPQMEIYNSHLADDLNEILKNSQNNISIRGKIENHMQKESNIAKYIKNKNYRSFDFADSNNENEQPETDQPLTFTLEDYKRIMALSNIDDKK